MNWNMRTNFAVKNKLCSHIWKKYKKSFAYYTPKEISYSKQRRINFRFTRQRNSINDHRKIQNLTCFGPPKQLACARKQRNTWYIQPVDFTRRTWRLCQKFPVNLRITLPESKDTNSTSPVMPAFCLLSDVPRYLAMFSLLRAASSACWTAAEGFEASTSICMHV